MKEGWTCPRCLDDNEVDCYLIDGETSFEKCKTCGYQVEITCHTYVEYDVVEVDE